MGRERTPWVGRTQEKFLKMVGPSVIRYAEWYCENGMYLPQKYKSDPSAWTQLLRDMQYTFSLILDDIEPETDVEKEVFERGLKSFYEHVYDLWR